MNAHLTACLRSLLLSIRYSEPSASLSALVLFHQLVLMHRIARCVNADQYIRLMTLAANACRYALAGYKQKAVAAITQADSAALARFIDLHSRAKER
ncbi:hypothetical protein D6Z43_27685 [Pseudomonas sp. DY-1]|uniref:hypothetical protein n=1 Tax=Pseudomonas sp. DY-1 TaxID=1755504 RepID=UPI000EA90652|nr:hypothetical protein [Pseudomonas sp. DY-1]AYF85645.1 hypothetical protein D6Z43_00070 [Pseudomonas sp. DY-1]AYF85662.1 hypothetical protein D6Z43_00165 [Pseudomonas sp. DY-1]AYF85682.1 hypothetical protein D6Z43_00270 [Pseudomonas sp. DY-1]AYF85698.1 hypothetical protein D6Z43_00365 [Pseudomonas sp. DY-1]AYF90729.1 hypothetical protein D6Z43_27685 [Pseudomonas sp. DY-1]